jgi:hypothetical protein
MQQSCLALFRREERIRACNLFWEEGKGQEHAAHFGKGEGGKNMKLVLGRMGSYPFSLLVFVAPKVC